MTMIAERREFERLTVNASCSIQSEIDGEMHAGVVVDVSEAGARVRLTSEWRGGDSCTLWFFEPRGALKVMVCGVVQSDGVTLRLERMPCTYD